MSLDAAIDKAVGRIELDAVTRLALELVSIPSPTGSEREVATFLADKMARGGLEVTLQDLGPNRANAVGVIRGEGDGPRVMFNGHLDTSITGIDYGSCCRHYESLIGPYERARRRSPATATTPASCAGRRWTRWCSGPAASATAALPTGRGSASAARP